MQSGYVSAPTSRPYDISRRAALGTLGLAAGQLGLGALRVAQAQSGGDAKKVKPDAAHPRIDAHVHVWTPDTKNYPLAAGFTKADMKPPSFTPQQLFAHAEPAGVGRIVLVQMHFYGFDNSYMLDAMHRHPGTFSGIAVIDEHHEPASLMRKLKEQGVRGFRLYAITQPVQQWTTATGMNAMWRCGAKEKLAMCALAIPEALPEIDRMCVKYPDTPVVIDHFARIGMQGPIRAADVDMLCRLARHKNTHVKVSAFYALGSKKPPYTDLVPMIRRLVDAFGPQRLMWGSDCPFQVDEHSYRDSISLVQEQLDFLSDEDRGWLLAKTAQRVFFS